MSGLGSIVSVTAGMGRCGRFPPGGDVRALGILDRGAVGHILAGNGVDAWGVATNGPALPGSPPLPTAISLLMRLAPAALAGFEHGPTEAYVAEYRRLNSALDAATAALVTALHRHGHEALAIPATVHGDYTLDPAAIVPGSIRQLPHKTVATQAGLGWIGKTALFVSREFGPAVRLATVFGDLPLAPGTPIATGRCGSCTACITACPAGCGRDVTWHAGMSRDELFDAAACERFMHGLDNDLGVCGRCVVACPHSEIG